jgi:adenylate cyclase
MKKKQSSTVSFVLVLLVLLLLAGLPFAVWLDLSNLVDTNLRRQAKDLNSIISSVRGYYAANVVGRVLASPGTTKVVHNYREVPGAIPIPATLSLELGNVISEQQQNIGYRFVSDYPFKNRPSHALDAFENQRIERIAAKFKSAACPSVGLSVQRSSPADSAGDHGAGLRQLPQLASRKPEI